MRAVYSILPALVLFVVQAFSQTTTNTLTSTYTAPPPGDLEKESKWSFSGSVYTYIVPDSREYVQPTITADHDWLHLEARYNYENLETVSTWVGYNLSGGEKLGWELTPMLGGVFGNTAGIAPGYKGSLSWWKLQLYSEGEYVVDTRNTSDSFFYNWSELTLQPLEWFRVGMVTQRTRLYSTDREMERGFLVGLTYKQFDLATYVFNPDESKPTVVIAFSIQLGQ